MNSLDDFARLRPESDAATSEELGALWNRATTGTVAEPTVARPVRSRRSRRRVAFWGAAASVALGVVAIASVSDRADAPPAVGEPVELTVADPPSSSVDVDPISTPVPSIEPADPSPVEAGDPPLWGVTEPGWSLVEFEDRTQAPVDSVRLFAGPDGLDTSWVAVVSGMSEPFLPAGLRPGDGTSVATGETTTDSASISTQRIATEAGTMAVIAGGVSDEQAMSVFRAVEGGGPPPDGFVESDSASAALRTVRSRFVNAETLESIDIEVHGAGSPGYDVERAAATAEEVWEGTAGVDDSNIAYVGEYTLLLRNGFWVTRVVTSAPFDAPTTFTRLAGLVQIVSSEQRDAALAALMPSLDRVALGDSVMLGAAEELTAAGFVVDATESRPFAGGVDVVRSLSGEDRLPATLVLGLGTNGPITQDAVEEMMSLLIEVDRVVVLTIRADDDVFTEKNALIRSLPETHRNVEVLDWDLLGDDCPGDCFFDDDLHLTLDGRRYYTGLIDAATT